MTLKNKTTHTWDVADEEGTIVHIESTTEYAKISAPNGESYITNVELRELAKAANAAAKV